MKNFGKKKAVVVAVVTAMAAVAIPVVQPLDAARPELSSDWATASPARASGAAASVSTQHTAPVLEQGDGYDVIEVKQSTIDRMLEEAEPEASRRPAGFADASVELVVISTPRGLRDLDLPEWFELEVLNDEGYSSWDDVSDSDLDVGFRPHYVHVPEVERLTEERIERAAEREASGLPTPRGWLEDECTKTVYKTINIDQDFDLRDQADLSTSFGNPNSGLSGSMGVGIDGVVAITGFANVKYERVRSICGGVVGWIVGGPLGLVAGVGLAQIPYNFVLLDSEIHIDASVDGTLSADAQVALRETLFRKYWDLFDYTLEIPIYAGIELHVLFEVAIDVYLKFEATARVQVVSQFDVDGKAGLSYACNGISCNKTREFADWTSELEDDPEILAQATVDVKLTPAIDFNVTAVAMLGAAGVSLPGTAFMGGTVGLVAQMPVRAYGTIGNLCSDADGDGTNESVQTFLLDVTAEVYVYYEVTIFGNKTLGYMNLRIPNGWVRKQAEEIVVSNVSDPAYVWEKNLFFKDLSSGSNTALESVVGRGGTYHDRLLQAGGEGTLREGIELFGPRSCYPFRTPATYEIDWGDGTTQRVHSEDDGLGFIAHDWRPAGRNQEYTVRTRIVEDDAGRRFAPRWTTKTVIAGSTAPDTPVNLRAEVYSGTTTELFWDAPDSDLPIVGYQVYRDEEHLETVDARSYLDKDGFDYSTYEVYAVNTQGTRSEVPATAGADLTRRPSTPTNVQAFRYSSTSGEITWDRSTDNGSVVKYEVAYWIDGVGSTDPRGIPKVDVEGNSFYISNLIPNLTYGFAVVAIDNDGLRSRTHGSVSLDLSSSTPPPDDPPVDDPPVVDPPVVDDPPPADPPSSGDSPSMPGNIRAERYSSTSGEIMWDRSTDPDGQIVVYRVVRNGVVLNASLDGLSYYESGMSTGSYDFEVYAIDPDGNASSPATVTLDLGSPTTPAPPNEPPPVDTPPAVNDPSPVEPPASDGAPTTPGGIRAERYSSTSGEIMWNRSVDPQGEAVTYRVVRDGVVVNASLDGLSYYESGMSTRSYVYEIYAVDRDGNASAPAVVTLDLT